MYDKFVREIQQSISYAQFNISKFKLMLLKFIRNIMLNMLITIEPINRTSLFLCNLTPIT